MASRPASEPESAGVDPVAEDEHAEWLRSFLLTWPGKIYSVDGADARDEAARQALTESARNLVEQVLRQSQAPERNDEPPP